MKIGPGIMATLPSANVPVTVLVDGRIVVGATPATLREGVVVAPLWPYVEGFAERVVRDRDHGSVTFERAGRRFRISLAPAGDGADAVVPLAAVARGLGATVRYDGATRTLQIDVEPEPLVTMTPYAAGSPPPGPFPTFTPTPTPAPSAPPEGVPAPRRTPIVIDSPQSAAGSEDGKERPGGRGPIYR